MMVNLFTARGVTFLFPIQAKTFYHVYDGKDLIAQARTGTGKTFSFAIPLIEKLLGEMQDRRRGRAPQVSSFNRDLKCFQICRGKTIYMCTYPIVFIGFSLKPFWGIYCIDVYLLLNQGNFFKIIAYIA